MTPADLELMGRLLYGTCWQTTLARNIGVTDRTVRNWSSGETRMKPSNEAQLKILMARHANFIRIILSNLESVEAKKLPKTRKLSV
jgi:DNA-binding XRE family transcriptional regulator